MRRVGISFSLASLVAALGLFGDAARAQKKPTQEEEDRPKLAKAAVPHAAARNGIVLGIGAGIVVPQAFSRLGSFPIFGLEVGGILPAAGRRIQLSGGIGYSQPPASGGTTDPRITSGAGGGAYRYNVTQQEYLLELAALFRVFSPGVVVNPYGKAGLRLLGMHTVVKGDASGSAFGRHTETNFYIGGIAGGGIDFRVGIGTLNLEILADFSDLNARMTGDTNSAFLSFTLGYRFYL